MQALAVVEKKFYLDSNVFISFIREEIDSSFNLRFQESKEFFKLCMEEKHEIILSELFFAEVLKITALKKELVLEEFKNLGIKIIEAVKIPSQSQIFKIMKQTGIHASDAMHIAFALENNADLIVTWNRKDFEKAKKLVKCITPNEASLN